MKGVLVGGPRNGEEFNVWDPPEKWAKRFCAPEGTITIESDSPTVSEELAKLEAELEAELIITYEYQGACDEQGRLQYVYLDEESL